jgi:NAD(P)-dependent dehydrogenase (short-subunit alcohol dehydrogenase family)
MTARTVVVTGGASGIGAAIASAMREGGDHVIVVDRAEPAAGGAYVSCDLADAESIESAVTQLPARIDLLVHSAGVSGLVPIPTVLAVNFYGLRRLTDALLDRIVDGGSVISVASTSGWFWRDHLDEISEVIAARTDGEVADVIARLIPDGYTAYARSKEAVVVWSAIAAQQNLGRVRFNSVSPGPIETPLLADFYEAMGHAELDPLTARSGGRNGKPEEIAAVVRFLASPEAMWVNGTDVPVDHGAEMAEFLAARGVIPALENA